MQFEPLHIGMDFNVGHMAAIVAESRSGRLYVLREFIDYMDTPDIITAIKDEFDRKIICYPDASGKKRTTSDASISDIALLRKAKFTVRAKSTNPPVKDRIAAVNMAFENGKLLINTISCPTLTEALEQQVYKENGQPDKESGLDHPLDALGYMVHYLMPVKENRYTKVAHAS